MPTFVSHRLKLAFCHVPRTAGTSIAQWLLPFLGDDVEMDNLEKHEGFHSLSLGRLKKELETYTKIAVVRNPLTWVPSMIGISEQAPQAPDPDFWQSQTSYLCNADGELMADVIFKFEYLPYCVIDFFKQFGVEGEFPHANRGTKRNISLTAIDSVMNLYKEDFVNFGYGQNLTYLPRIAACLASSEP